MPAMMDLSCMGVRCLLAAMASTLAALALVGGVGTVYAPVPTFTVVAASTTSLITREPVEESFLKGPW